MAHPPRQHPLRMRLWNPKARAWAVVHVTPDLHATHHRVRDFIYVHSEDEAADAYASGEIMRHTSDDYAVIFVGDRTRPLRQGWGLVLYLAMALAAEARGGRGIKSSAGRRTAFASDAWLALYNYGYSNRDWEPEDEDEAGNPPDDAEETLDAKAVRRLYANVPGVVFPEVMS